MIKAPIPENDEKRLHSLKRLNLLDTPAEEQFDRITRLARRTFQVPISYVSLVDRERQWFKSVDGLDVMETPRDISFCGHAILTDQPLIVEDAMEDERFADNPFVIDQPFIRFYAGQPVKSPDGYPVGTFCIADRKPREMKEEDRRTLGDFAHMVENELASEHLCQQQKTMLLDTIHLRNHALLDAETRMWSRTAIHEILAHSIERSWVESSWLGVLLVECEITKEVPQRVRASLRPTDSAGRTAPDEFLIVLPRTALDQTITVARRIEEEVPVPITIGVTSMISDISATEEDYLSAVETALYRAKLNRSHHVECYQPGSSIPGDCFCHRD